MLNLFGIKVTISIARNIPEVEEQENNYINVDCWYKFIQNSVKTIWQNPSLFKYNLTNLVIGIWPLIFFSWVHTYTHTSTLLESGTMVTENKVYLDNEIIFNC